MATQLTDFNVQGGEVVIVEGEVARTALLTPEETGGKFSTLSKFVRLTNAKVVDDSRGANLAKFVQAHISPAEPHWYTATTKLENINVIDNAGAQVTLQGELRRGQIVRVAINAFVSKNYDRVGSGLQAVLVPDASKIEYAENAASAATSSLFGLNDVAGATQTPVSTPASTPTPAPKAETPASSTVSPNPFASSSAATTTPTTNEPEVNPFAQN